MAVLYYIILYLRRKEYRTLSKAVLLVIVGAIVAWIPVVVYLISIGGIRAVSDMVYAVFVYNVKYNIVWPTIAGDASVVRNILMLFPCLFFLFYSIFLYRISRLFAGICGIIATVCIMLLVKSSGYNHYFILELPVVFLCTIGVLELCEDMKLKWLMSFIVLAVMFIPVIYCAGYSYYVKLYFENCFVTPQESQRNVSPIMELVTEEERDSIYCYRVNNYVFDEIYRAEVMPLGKYFYLQEQLCIVDDKIRNEINNFVSTTPPLWILSGNYDLPKNPVVDISKYTEIYSDDNVVLLRRKQE